MTDTPTEIARNHIDGSWVSSTGADLLEVVNPATLEVAARVPDSSPTDVDRAVRAARHALPHWRRTNPFVRAQLLHEIAEEVGRQVDAIATAITTEMGKPLDEARGEVRKLAQAFHYYAEETTRVLGTVIPNEAEGFTSLVRHEPIGVVAAISPWNYPVELIGWKLAAALGAGCTLVLKPSEYSPTSAVRLWECLAATDLPPGVANLVLGAAAPGTALVSHPEVDKVAFTGSAATGLAITRSTASAIPLSMELGGSCPLIVSRTADVAAAVAGTTRRAFRNAGQICIAINRAYVHRDVHDEYLSLLADAVAALVVDDGLATPAADVGPVANRPILDRTTAHVADALDRGARLLVGATAPADRAGLFFPPTVLADCDPEMLIMHAETFGPVLGVRPYQDLAEAIELANGTPAGLAAYAYTTDLAETFRLGRDLDFGNVAVNNVDAGIMNAPYGGRKGSGYGYEHGPEGLHGYLQLKHLRIRHGQ